MQASVDSIPCPTGDGLQLSVRRIRATKSPARGPVILQHGLGSNGEVFDLPGRSFAQRLAAEGFDCFISELRGAGGSQRPHHRFGLDDYLDYDVPAILNAVRTASGHSTVQWVGHSMGGILLMLYGIDHPELPVTRLVAVASALDYKPGKSVFRQMRKFRWLGGQWLKTFPFSAAASCNALVAGVGPIFAVEAMNFWRSNVEREVSRAVMRRCFTPIAMQLFDDLDTTFDELGFSRKAGTITYLDRAQSFRVPTCLIAGSRDAQATGPAMDETARLLSSVPDLRLLRFGKAYGQPDEYGHIDLLVGRRAEQEVWPSIIEFLRR